jgi:predicted ester cyclase
VAASCRQYESRREWPNRARCGSAGTVVETVLEVMMSIEANKQVATSMWQAVAASDWAALGAAYAENATYHGSGPTELQGRDQLVGLAQGYKTAMPDLTITPVHVLADGDLVCSWVRLSGTNTGPLGGNPPTGRKVTLVVVNAIRVVDGKVVEEWECFDQLDLHRQLGQAAAV